MACGRRRRTAPIIADRLTLPAQRREITDGDYYQSDVTVSADGSCEYGAVGSLYLRAGRRSTQVLSAWGRPLSGGVNGVQRLARRHKEPVALGTPKADIAADFRQPDAANQLALRRPYRHAAITDGTASVARGPHISVDIAAHAVGTAFHPVNHTVGEQFLVGQLVVWTDIKHVDLTLTAWTSVAGPLPVLMT